MKFIKRILLVTCNSYVSEHYSIIFRIAEVKRETYSVFQNHPEWNTLEDKKKYYSNDHSAILSFGPDIYSNRLEMVYAIDWDKRLADIRDEEWTFNSEEEIKSLLTEEEWNVLMSDGIVEPSQAYVEPHQQKDGYWMHGDYYTRLRVL